MKELTIFLLVWAFSMGSAFAQEGTKGQTFIGTISDDMCGQKHTMMPGKSDKECVLACIKMDAKLVLADDAGKAVYQLDDQKLSEKFAGEKVRITGTLDKKTKTIQVNSIEPVKAE
ncbi:MAG: hypothetical protein HY650_09750 [Acidobacteria bacterium]|nr:hypothetical protein [Acidobacteriota bacterium]